MTFTHLPTAWRTRDGRIVKLVDMEDSHLTNVIGHCYKAAAKVAQYIFMRDLTELAGAAATLNSEGAQDAIHGEIYRLEPHTEAEVLATWPIWHALVKEADRRAAREGLIPLPERTVTNVPCEKDVPRWAAVEPRLHDVDTDTQVREPVRVVAITRAQQRAGRARLVGFPRHAIKEGEGEETNWGDKDYTARGQDDWYK